MILLGAASCRDDWPYDYGEIGEGESLISATVNFYPLVPALDNHSRTAGNAIKSINSLFVLAYDADGNLVRRIQLHEGSGENGYSVDNEPRTGNVVVETIGGEYKELPAAEAETPRATFKLRMPYGRYRIYAVANIEDLFTTYASQIETEAGLKGIPLVWNSGSVASNNQMFGHFDQSDGGRKVVHTDAPLLIVNKDDISLHAWIRRAASKITVAYDGSRLEEGIFVYLKSVTIKDIPSVCKLGETNSITDASQLEDGECVVYGNGAALDEYYPARITKGRPDYPYVENQGKYSADPNAHSEYQANSLFFYENMQGEGNDKRQDHDGNGVLDNPGYPGDNTYSRKDGKPCGTYIEVDAFYYSINPDRPGSGDIKFRFMLGKNVTTDYNAERNHHYKLTLVFNRFANDADWHIEYREDVPSIQVPVPYYISYLYNHEASMPVKVNVKSGYKLKSLTAEIDSNAWAPYRPDPGLDYHTYWDPVKTPSVGKNPWNGFLSLRKDGRTVINGTYGGSAFDTVNKSDYENSSKPQGSRTYFVDGKWNSADANKAGHGYYAAPTVDAETNQYIFNLPIYTRAKQLTPRSAYTGNNPYVAYQRKAVVKFTAVMYNERNPSDEITVTNNAQVIQVRRVVNPKGVWRAAADPKDFHVVLKRLPRESAGTFETFTSEGAWRAFIARGDRDFISLSGASGSTGSPIDFYINFRGSIGENETKCAVVRVEYHNYSCVHLIFVRQGNAPMAMLSDGALWHTGNMRTGTVEVDNPADEGSMFRFGNWSDPIDATNNVFNSSYPDQSSTQFLIAGTADTRKAWNRISSQPRTGTNARFRNVTVKGKTLRVAKCEDYDALYESDDIELGYGVLYGDDAEETLSDVNQVYGYRWDNYGKGYGMRGVFVYNTAESGEYSGRNLFFPIGATGYGRRKHSDGGRVAVLKYAQRSALAPVANNATDKRPLFYDLYRRPGAVYWLAENHYLERGPAYNKNVIAWDFNYFTFDFNYMTNDNPFANDNANVSDACFVRCVEDP